MSSPLAAREPRRRRQALRIGRTPWKLRNPSNTPPAWATPLLEDRPETPRFAAGPDGALGATFPIRVAEPCLRCHGAAESLAVLRVSLREPPGACVSLKL
ncbi:MAG: hypothetical protein AAGC60_17905 [Acidobacteriota bacterium]